MGSLLITKHDLRLDIAFFSIGECKGDLYVTLIVSRGVLFVQCASFRLEMNQYARPVVMGIGEVIFMGGVIFNLLGFACLHLGGCLGLQGQRIRESHDRLFK